MTTEREQRFASDLNDPVVLERFWRYVFTEPNSGCWLWDGRVSTTGYGYINARKKLPQRGMQIKAHRFSLGIRLGRPPVGFVLHSCDNPICVNPDHLREGTGQENMDDMNARGRRPIGSRNVMAVLDESTVTDVKRRLANKEPHQSIADDVGVHRVTISKIKRGLLWAHVPFAEDRQQESRQ